MLDLLWPYLRLWGHVWSIHPPISQQPRISCHRTPRNWVPFLWTYNGWPKLTCVWNMVLKGPTCLTNLIEFDIRSSSCLDHLSLTCSAPCKLVESDGVDCPDNSWWNLGQIKAVWSFLGLQESEVAVASLDVGLHLQGFKRGKIFHWKLLPIFAYRCRFSIKSTWIKHSTYQWHPLISWPRNSWQWLFGTSYTPCLSFPSQSRTKNWMWTPRSLRKVKDIEA